jgi:hypothetical protein
MTRRGTDNITVRMAHDLWERFGEFAENRSTVLRDFVRWYVREPGSKLPARPSGVSRSDSADRGDYTPDSAA